MEEAEALSENTSVPGDTTSGSGSGAGGVIASDSAGSGSGGGVVAPAEEEEPVFEFPDTDDTSLVVSARYGSAEKWTYHVRKADTATECDGSETWKSDCIHGGEHRKVVTALTGCSGLEMVDRLNAFTNRFDDGSVQAGGYGLKNKTPGVLGCVST